MAVINMNNQNYKTGKYPLFLGEGLGLYDSANVPFPELFNLYKKQKAQDWSEDEVSLDQSRKDFATCSKNNYDVMIKTLSWQWEADSVARSIITLFAPFISNNELGTMMTKQSEIEVLHGLTYGEIVRQCIPNSNELFDEISKNQDISDRLGIIAQVFTDLQIAGAKYTLGMIEADDQLRLLLWKGIIALLGLEGIEFVSSFAATFSLAEQGLFVGAAKLIQKIMLDEVLHTHMDLAVINGLMSDPQWKKVFDDNKEEIKSIIDAVVEQEKAWSEYIFSEGRVILGLNELLLKDWVYYNAGPIYKKLKLDYDFVVPKNNPLPWMDTWLNPDLVMTANQEIQSTAYKINIMKQVDDNVEFDF